MKPIRWGVLGVSNFAMRRSLPGLLGAASAQVLGIASRDLAKAQAAAAQHGLPRAYGSYEELLADPDIDAVYNPLPNHLHVPWSIKAAEAGKHVLCEKPIGLSQAEIRTLIAARDQANVQVAEAFMVAVHPQWLRAREIVQSGALGPLRAYMGVFSYYNEDPANIRNQAHMGGGGLMDIGCYPIFTSRFVTGEEPLRVAATMDRDPRFGTDRLTSAILEFPGFQAVFTCAMQMVHYQRVNVMGTKGRVEIEIPFNAPPDRPVRIIVDDGRDVIGTGRTPEEFPAVDQYSLQADTFAAAIRGERPVAVPLEDSLRNMAVIEAIVRAAESGRWEPVI